MLKRLQTRSGDTIWYRAAPYLGRRNIAQAAFTRWELREEGRKIRELEQLLNQTQEKA